MIDNNQTIGPLYQKVKDHVVNKIAAGELLANARVPSENELVELLGVSRMTANRALKELAAEGLVTRIAGVGTFVAAPRTNGHLLEVRNIAEEVRERGHNYSNRVVSHRSVAVTPSIVAAMELAEGVAEVYHSLIVHLEDGRRLQVEERLVNAEVAPDYIDIDLDETTPAAYLLAKLPLHKVEHTVRAAMPSASIKKFLKMADNVPCLILDRRTWSSGTLVSVAHLYHCSQSFSLTETLQKDG
ncbi:MAG: histidine utilization repressor [Porticoccaceae bacterium]|nr:histidine utilization repressor [Porticoccaceae bacterium]